MHFNFKRLAKKTLKRFDIGVTSYRRLQSLEKGIRASNAIELLFELPDRHRPQLLRALRRSNSQLGQDLFVLSEMDFKTDGFFVEFGATNGVLLSNVALGKGIWMAWNCCRTCPGLAPGFENQSKLPY